MILVITEFTLPLLGFVALNKFLTTDKSENEKKKPLQLAFYIVGGLTILFALMPSLIFVGITGYVSGLLLLSVFSMWFILYYFAVV